MASYSAQTLINLALTDIGILEQGGTPSNSDSNAVLALLNNMVQSWQLQDKFIWSNAPAGAYALTASQSTYPIGPGATAPFNVNRPTFITRASAQSAGGVQSPIEIITIEQYRMITDLSASGLLPQKLYYDRLSPIGNLVLYPTPNSSAVNLILDAWAQLGTFAALTTTVDLPDGYPEAIAHALAVRCLPMFGVAVQSQVAGLVSELAKQAEEAIVSFNQQARRLMLEAPAGGAAPAAAPNA